MDDFERKWELIREQLRIQATGETPPRISSGRTLFGIKSEVEEKMDAIAPKWKKSSAPNALRAKITSRASDPNKISRHFDAVLTPKAGF